MDGLSMNAPVFSPPPVAVFKTGGSLLSLPAVGQKLDDILQRHHPVRPLLIAGGGAAAEVVRHWDAVHQPGEEVAHWLAVETMSLNARLVHVLLPEAELVESRSAAETVWARHRRPVLLAGNFLRDEESRLRDDGREADCLPHNWNVTSDSIAAWVALRWPADELILLKSCNPPANPSPLLWREVDAHFPRLLPELKKQRKRIGWVNLRADSPVLEWWEPE